MLWRTFSLTAQSIVIKAIAFPINQHSNTIQPVPPRIWGARGRNYQPAYLTAPYIPQVWGTFGSISYPMIIKMN